MPIKISSVAENLYTGGTLGRRVLAHVINGAEKTQIGRVHLTIPKAGKHATIVMTAVEEKFRGHGISRELFKHAQELLGRAGKLFIRGDEIQHVAQVKIRRSAGKSVFIGTGFGPFGENNKKLKTGREAIEIIKNPGRYGQTVHGTTMIPKKFRGRKR